VIYADSDQNSERHRRALRNRAIEMVIAKHRTVPYMVADLENIIGLLNARMPDCITPRDSVFVSSAVLTFTEPSSNSVAA
jgi:hypothetical protein